MLCRGVYEVVRILEVVHRPPYVRILEVVLVLIHTEHAFDLWIIRYLVLDIYLRFLKKFLVPSSDTRAS